MPSYKTIGKVTSLLEPFINVRRCRFVTQMAILGIPAAHWKCTGFVTLQTCVSNLLYVISIIYDKGGLNRKIKFVFLSDESFHVTYT